MASISGLSSGLDTATIINQLMQLEAAPQTRLKSRVSSESSSVSVLQSLNTKLTLLGVKAKALVGPQAGMPLTSTSSNAAVSVATTSTASPASLSVTVTSVARTHQVGFTDPAALTDVVTGATTRVRLDRFDGSPVELDTGDGTLSGLVTAINATANETGLRASTVKVADGSYRLLVESQVTGAEQDFEITAEDGSALLGGSTVRAGTDAAIDLGAGISVSSTTNTFSDVLPGITLTLGDAATTGTVSSVAVSRDTAALTSSVKGLVDALNSALGDIDTQSKYNATTKTAGPLTGNATVRSLRTSLLESVYPADGGTLASLGIQVTRDGQLSFDSSAFAQAYAADPAGVADRISGTTGFAAAVAKVTTTASDATTGTLTTAITGRRTGITRMEGTIADWDRRLELRRTALERQFTSLETALNQMTSQSSWLSGQLASLPSNNNG